MYSSTWLIKKWMDVCVHSCTCMCVGYVCGCAVTSRYFTGYLANVHTHTSKYLKATIFYNFNSSLCRGVWDPTHCVFEHRIPKLWFEYCRLTVEAWRISQNPKDTAFYDSFAQVWVFARRTGWLTRSNTGLKRTERRQLRTKQHDLFARRILCVCVYFVRYTAEYQKSFGDSKWQ